MILIVVSTGHFDPLIEACNRLSHQYSFLGQIGMSHVVPNFPHFRTAPPRELEKHMQEAELVISHAGTGMLSMLYNLKKPSIICPKQIRYGESNDGQVELGRKWSELGMGILSMDVEGIGAAIEQSRHYPFKFPEFPSLGRTLAQMLSSDTACHGLTLSSNGR